MKLLQAPVLFAAALLVPIAYSLTLGRESEPEMKRCVDASDHVVSDSFCAQPLQTVAVRGSLNAAPAYRAYYGGYGSYQTGSHAWGGSDRPLMGHVYQTGPDSLAPDDAQAAAINNSYQPYVAGPH